jgi:hypothetical protein
MLFGRNIPQLTISHQFLKNTMSGGGHLCTHQLEFPTGEDRLLDKVFRQLFSIKDADVCDVLFQ